MQNSCSWGMLENQTCSCRYLQYNSGCSFSSRIKHVLANIVQYIFEVFFLLEIPTCSCEYFAILFSSVLLLESRNSSCKYFFRGFFSLDKSTCYGSSIADTVLKSAGSAPTLPLENNCYLIPYNFPHQFKCCSRTTFLIWTAIFGRLLISVIHIVYTLRYVINPQSENWGLK